MPRHPPLRAARPKRRAGSGRYFRAPAVQNIRPKAARNTASIKNRYPPERTHNIACIMGARATRSPAAIQTAPTDKAHRARPRARWRPWASQPRPAKAHTTIGCLRANALGRARSGPRRQNLGSTAAAAMTMTRHCTSSRAMLISRPRHSRALAACHARPLRPAVCSTLVYLVLLHPVPQVARDERVAEGCGPRQSPRAYRCAKANASALASYRGRPSPRAPCNPSSATAATRDAVLLALGAL